MVCFNDGAPRERSLSVAITYKEKDWIDSAFRDLSDVTHSGFSCVKHDEFIYLCIVAKGHDGSWQWLCSHIVGYMKEFNVGGIRSNLFLWWLRRKMVKMLSQRRDSQCCRFLNKDIYIRYRD